MLAKMSRAAVRGEALKGALDSFIMTAGCPRPVMRVKHPCGAITSSSFKLGMRRMSSLPPHTAIAMPALSPTMKAGNIAGWKVAVGDKVAPGDHLCDVETDKATMGWESQEDGFVAKILRESGSNEVPVGEIVLVICEDKGDVAAFKDFVPAASKAAPAAVTPKPAPAAATPAQPPPALPAASPHVAPKIGGSMLEAVKGKKWAYTSQFGLATPQNTYY